MVTIFSSVLFHSCTIFYAGIIFCNLVFMYPLPFPLPTTPLHSLLSCRFLQFAPLTLPPIPTSAPPLQRFYPCFSHTTHHITSHQPLHAPLLTFLCPSQPHIIISPVRPTCTLFLQTFVYYSIVVNAVHLIHDITSSCNSLSF